MLHFAQFEPDVSRWLGGDYLADLGGCDPSSRPFAEFATSAGAADLLAVSAGWCRYADIAVEFSEMAADPMSVLQHEGLGAHRIIGDPRMVGRAASFDGFHQTETMHGWLGQVGYWRRYIPLSLAEEIYEVHESVFVSEGYCIELAEELDVRQVRLAWAAEFAGRTSPPLAAPVREDGFRTRLAVRGSRRTRS